MLSADDEMFEGKYRFMAITNYQVQNILKSYTRQLIKGHRMARAKNESTHPYHLRLDVEARRKLVVAKITAEIVNNIGIANFGPGLDDVELLAMRQLSKEYGQPLMLQKDEFSGKFRFTVQLEKQNALPRELGQEENAKLEDRLYYIAQNIIENNML
jgi:hypothetical protein